MSNKLFSSARLTYKAVESPEHDDFIHSLEFDTESVTNANGGLQTPPTKAKTKKYLEYLTTKALIAVVIYLSPSVPTESPTPIGQIHVQTPGETPDIDRHGDIVIDIARPYMGQGYGSEAIKWILWYCFHVAGMHRVSICVFGHNEGALRLYQRLGFILEGRMRAVYWIKGKWQDDLHLGMLDHEWRALYGASDEEKEPAAQTLAIRETA